MPVPGKTWQVGLALGAGSVFSRNPAEGGVSPAGQLNPSDPELLRRARAGEEAALTMLYERHYSAVYRFARHMSGDAALAEEAAQEVFLALIRRSDGYDPERGAVPAYLLGIARHWLARRWRQEARWAPLNEEVTAAPSGDDGSEGAWSPERREAIAAVQRAIAALPEPYRAVVVLCDIEEHSYEEVARALACPLGTVRSRLHRARALLARKLASVRPGQETHSRPARPWPAGCEI